MAKTIENLFFILHHTSNGLVILLFLFFIKRTRREKGLILITVYCFSDILLNIVDDFSHQIASLYISAFFTFLEYALFSFFILMNLKKRSIKRSILILSALFIVFISIYNILTDFKHIDSIPIGIETILILLYSFYYLYEQMNDTSNLFIYSQYQFWVIIGFMIYLAGSFFVFIFASHLGKNLLNQYWFLTNAFYTMMNLLFMIAIVIYSRQQVKSPYAQKLHPYLN